VKAAVYVRISSDPEGLRAGVERQRLDCVEWCERRGWEVEVFEDNDASAYRGKPRPAYDRMLAAVADRTVGAIVAWAPDRLTRHLKELETLITTVEGAGCQLATVQAGEWDLASPEGRFMARQLGLMARLESEKIAARVQKAMASDAKAGRPMRGGMRPWGYAADHLTVDPGEAEQVRDAARSLLAGESLTGIARRLGRQPASIRNALSSPRMIGHRTYRGVVVHEGAWEAVLDPDTWEAVRAVLSARKRPLSEPGGARARKYLLTGFVRCGPCGAKAHGIPNKGRRGYQCQVACTRRQADYVDDMVRDWVLDRADLPVERPEVDPQLRSAVHGFEARVAELDDSFLDAANMLPAQVYGKQRAQLVDRLEEARVALAAAEADTEVWLDTEHLARGDRYAVNRAWWDAHPDLRQRRLLVERYAERVVLHPAPRGPGFRPESVEIVPKAKDDPLAD
jgi:site-specific DNA recombinase